MKLRDLWPNEALDFTPWLKNNNIIADIAKSLQLTKNPLELYKTEVKCGDYRIDMIYREQNGKGGLLVENQYGQSDSKHLGQILVYSYLTKVKTILWICEEVRREHIGCVGMVENIEVWPVGASVREWPGGYLLIFSVYGKKRKDFIYHLDENKNVLYRKSNG